MVFRNCNGQCQTNTEECRQFKGGKAVTLGNRPMHRWESTWKFYAKVEKVLLSIENFLAEIDSRGWAKDAKQTSIYPANYLMQKFPSEQYLITMAAEMDILDILIVFVKKSEFVDQDVSRYLEEVEDVRLELTSLKSDMGAHTEKMIQRLCDGDLKDWCDDDVDEHDLRDLHDESADLFVKLWKERFPEDDGEHHAGFTIPEKSGKIYSFSSISGKT